MDVGHLKENIIENCLTDNIYAVHLKVINGIAFTPREIDIISCLLNGRSTKRIASILLIAPKTAEHHIRNIMLKISCRSQEEIIDFVERSGKLIYIKQYYTTLLIQKTFLESLQKIAAEKVTAHLNCLLVHYKEKILCNAIEEHLQLLGISTQSEEWGEKMVNNPGISSLMALQGHIICKLPMAFVNSLQSGEKKAIAELQELIQSFKRFQSTTFIILNKESNHSFPTELDKIKNLFIFNQNDYYALFFQILRKLLPAQSLDKHVEYFYKYKEAVHDPQNNALQKGNNESSIMNPKKEMLSQGNNKTSIENRKPIQPKGLFQNKTILGLILASVLVLISPATVVYILYRDNGSLLQHKDKEKNPVQTTGKDTLAKESTAVPAESPLPTTWNLPRQDNLFVGREKLLQELHERLRPPSSRGNGTKVSSVDSNTLAISACAGLGGIGKTQLALQYAHHTKHPYTIRVWFEAENIRELQSEYQMFAKRLGYTTNSDWISKNKEIEAVIQYVKKWMENNPGWLIIYDNATNFETIKDFLPEKGGDILITTRCQEWPHIVEILSIDVMEPTEAHALVKELIEREDQNINILTKTLEYLPLSLSQAAAYIRNYNKTVEQYLSLYHQSEYTLLQDKTMPLGVNHAPVAVTWDVSFRAIESEEKEKNIPALSRMLLTVCSYLSTKNISRDLLLTWVKKNYPNLKEPEWALDQSLGQLKRHSLINLDSKNVSIHRMVQTILRHQHHQKVSKASSGEYYSPLTQKWYEGLLEVVHQEFSRETQVLEDEARVRILFPHMQKSVGHYEELWPQLGSKILGSIYNDMGLFFFRLLQDLKYAQFYFEKALAISEQHYGKNHVIVASILNNTGTVYRELGDEKKARKYLERALAISEKHFGENHVEVGNILNNLGKVYREFGTFELVNQSKTVIERALAINLLHYGKNHLQTGNTLQNLGNTYRELGDAQQAKKLLEKALLIRERYYGSRHPKIGRTLNRLVDVYQELGELKHAKELIERALSINEEHYGKDHIYNTRTINRLGDICRELGELQQAKELLERALAIREQFYGTDHAWLVWSLDRLGELYRDMGELDKARQLLERAVALNEQHYGQYHVWIGKSLTRLGEVFVDSNELEQAKSTLERALNIYEQFYGKNHIEVARTMVALGMTHAKMGDPKKGKVLLEQALAINESHYGKNHVKILDNLAKLVEVHKILGEEMQVKERLVRLDSIKSKAKKSN